LQPLAERHTIFQAEQELLRRLAADVRQGIQVPPHRSAPRTAISLLEDDIERLPIATDLKNQVRAWKAEADKYAHATGENDAEVWEWQDAGTVLAAQVDAALGDDYSVAAF
jgi:hypothetical protein